MGKESTFMYFTVYIDEANNFLPSDVKTISVIKKIEGGIPYSTKAV